jgi:hypothetical protein
LLELQTAAKLVTLLIAGNTPSEALASLIAADREEFFVWLFTVGSKSPT